MSTGGFPPPGVPGPAPGMLPPIDPGQGMFTPGPPTPATGKTLPRQAPPDLDEKRKALVKKRIDDVKAARKHWEPVFRQMIRDQKFCAGRQWEEESKASAFNDGLDDRYVANVTLRHVAKDRCSLRQKPQGLGEAAPEALRHCLGRPDRELPDRAESPPAGAGPPGDDAEADARGWPRRRRFSTWPGRRAAGRSAAGGNAGTTGAAGSGNEWRWRDVQPYAAWAAGCRCKSGFARRSSSPAGSARSARRPDGGPRADGPASWHIHADGAVAGRAATSAGDRR